MMVIGCTNCYFRLFVVVLFAIPARCFVAEKVFRPLRKTAASIGSSSTSIDAARTREDADLLPLSKFDQEKFHHMKTRGRVMPIIIMGEPILPGQRLYFRSGDPKFEELIKYIAQIENDCANSGVPDIEIGILGLDNGRPAYTGVTAHVATKNFAYSLTAENRDRAITTSFKGTDIFRLASDPWMDPTGSFHMAHVEILDCKYDDVTHHTKRRDIQIQIEVDELFAQIPALVDEWMGLMFKASLTTPASLVISQREVLARSTKQQLQGDPGYLVDRRNNNYALYPPSRQTDRAVWVAALLNPIRRYPVVVSEEIRPTFLACRNDRDRLDLCISALRNSIGFLETYIDAKNQGNQGLSGSGT